MNIPLDQVFPIFVKQLPLKEDFEENKAVFKSILILYEAGHPILHPHMETLLEIAVNILHENTATDDGKLFNVFLLFCIIKDCCIIIHIKLCSIFFMQKQKVLL